MTFLKLPIGPPTIELIKLSYCSAVPVLLVGPHGIGKSDVFRHAAKELGIDHIECDLSVLEPTDLIGIPAIDGRTTSYFPPSFLPQEGTTGLLVLEELNRCPTFMRAPCLQLLTARRLNDYILPSGWLPCASINPSDDNYEVDELDPALSSRFIVAAVSAHRKEWIRWAELEEIHPSVLAYIKAHADVFSQPDSSPRAWTCVSKVMRAAERTGTSRRTVRAAIAGLIGANRAAAFFAFATHSAKPFAADDILKRFPLHSVTLRTWIIEGRTDLVEQTVANVLSFLQAKANVQRTQANPRTWRNLGQFIQAIPGDFRERAVQHLKAHGHTLPEAPEVP